MTRVAFVADVHLGNHKRLAGDRQASLNRRCREGVAVFAAAAARAVELGCSAFVVLGDLIDTQRPEPQLLAAVQRALAPAAEAGVRVLLLVGNHEQVTDAAGDHALGPLAPYATVVDRPSVYRFPGSGPRTADVEVGLVPFRAGKPASEWLPGVVRDLMPPRRLSRPERRVLGVHLGVRDSDTAPWLRDAPDAVDAADLAALAGELRAGTALAGNWHERHSWRFEMVAGDVRVLQLGALVPTGWDNPGVDDYGTLAVWEDGAVTHEVLPGPRFVQVDSPARLTAAVEHARVRGCRLYVQFRAPPEGLASAVLALHEAAGEPVPLEGDLAAGLEAPSGKAGGFRVESADLVGEVVVDGAAVEEQARTAASAASGAASLEESLAGFLSEMPLEPGLDRAAVGALVRGYLGMPGGSR